MRAPWIRFVFLIAFGGNHYGRWLDESFKSLIKISFGFNLIYIKLSWLGIGIKIRFLNSCAMFFPSLIDPNVYTVNNNNIRIIIMIK